VGCEVIRAVLLSLLLTAVGPLTSSVAFAQGLPRLADDPVNDFAHVVDADSARGIERLSRALKKASGDVVMVVTVPTIEPYGTIDEYTTKLFEQSRIGEKGKDNGLLIVLALKERRARIEPGYALEQFITDRFAGETIRAYMAPEFRNGAYGQGLLVATARIVGRIAKGRGVTLPDVQLPADEEPEAPRSNFPLALPVIIFIIILIVARIGGGPGAGMLLWGLGPWSRWSSGVGSFGGGRGGGFGGGGFGGGFGGFGGGGSGGGGASGGW
jgi:uncharacterized protein